MANLNIIPYPRSIKFGDPVRPEYALGGGSGIITNTSGFLQQYSREKFDCSISEVKGMSDSGIFFLAIGHDPGLLPAVLPDCLNGQEEGYYLFAGKAAAVVAAGSEKGLFYGVQTLYQLMLDGISSEVEIIDWPQSAIRGFHFEVRYGIPHFNRILEIIDEIAHYKFNTLLMEFEDKFPYASVPGVASENALTLEQVRRMEKYAQDRFVDIIPLQQTLGHLEYVLKKDEYHHLREVREEPHPVDRKFSKGILGFNHFNQLDEICISSEEACKLVERLLDDIISLFPERRYVHIGCDEAWNLSYCSVCKEKDSRNRLFIEHANRMAKKVKAAGKTPVMWDDMLRHFSDTEMQMLDKDMVLVCWLYYKYEIGDAKDLIRRYKSFGYQVLGASSAKCSAGLEVNYFDLPDFRERAGNIADWAELSEEMELPGVITTVWSNYTGTIAPPHPFFDTAWYPVLLSADMYWNAEAGLKKAFEARFFANYFNTEIEESVFSNNYEEIYEVFNSLCEKPLRHAYVAEAYKWMYFLALYRKKSLVTNRELYKLFNESSIYEKEIVLKRTEDLALMRQYLKTGLRSLLERHYPEAEVREFMDSRFFIDEALESLLVSNKGKRSFE